MEKKRILSFVLLTSLAASTMSVNAAWPFSSKPKTFTEKMYGMLCATLQAGDDFLTQESEVFKDKMPGYIRGAIITTLAGIAAKGILKYIVFTPYEKIANFFSSDPKVSVSKKDLQQLLQENEMLKNHLLKIMAQLKNKKSTDQANKNQTEPTK